ncbi:arsenical pump-driving ATPase [Paenibacillus dendritiformis]|uniref:arsenical pump-driving ATPase n=1 Tax=Paenibacillus dendritiformis TaxID=130049 RepID=UPI00248B70C3|nr:arsenical pump-driving ATPase [Paenibacillus dendritiformis]WGU96292.1 arsenical pump-driving ATPase [Paenibacillus dendritiformis]
MNYIPLSIQQRFLFFTGKGGVGKTSVAAATAITLASEGRNVLLVSTDPASNLDDVLDTALGQQPTPIPAVPWLYGINIDPEQAARDYRDQVVAPYRGILPDSAVAQIEEQLSGACTVEIAAFDEFTKWLADTDENRRFDHIIFDTAPTGHTLRLLQLPKAWEHHIDTSRHGASCLGPLSGLQAKKELYSHAVLELSNADRTALYLVARPDQASLAEAARASGELRELGLLNQHLIINGMLKTDGQDPYAARYASLQHEALQGMPHALQSLPRYEVRLKPMTMTGIHRLRQLLTDTESIDLSLPDYSVDPIGEAGLSPLLQQWKDKKSGVIMTMGKGGVGKTTVAAALAVGLARMGRHVHLSTTDPAAHLTITLGDGLEIDRLTVSRIDPKAETEAYVNAIMAANQHLAPDELELLQEDLNSPCTEEIAVFRAFARTVDQINDGFVVLDTAPTGHTLMLLDAAEAYHREVSRSAGDSPEEVHMLLPRLRNKEETSIIIVTLPDATPVLEAERLQQDLIRASITPSWWVVNQSWQGIPTHDPVLRQRVIHEKEWIQRVKTCSTDMTIVPWQEEAPIGEELLQLIN